MYGETIEKISASSKVKADFLSKSIMKYFVLSIFAGFYIGIGIFLIQNVGAPLGAAGSPFTRLIMGVSFSIALTLVVFAGAELFTGNAMIMTIGLLNKHVKFSDLLKVFIVSYIGNLVGSMLLAYFIQGSGFLSGPTGEFIAANSAAKMNAPIMALLFRSILCNMLVCLALWSGFRTTSDSAKYILIFLCLFAFISSGYEHSVANMSLLYMGVLSKVGDLTMANFWYNISIVTIGNVIGGALFVGAAYWYVSKKD